MFCLTLLFLLICSPDSPDNLPSFAQFGLWTQEAWRWFLNNFPIKDNAVPWFFGAILLSIIFAILTLTTFVINTIWQFIFYSYYRGYNKKEYYHIREALLDYLKKNYSWDENLMKYLEGLPIQPIYGQLLHSFAKQSFIQWLTVRWKTYHLNMSSCVGIFFGEMLGFIVLFNWYRCEIIAVSMLWVLVPIILILILGYIGYKRQKELLLSEELFCRSICNKNLREAFDEVSKIITSRNIDKNAKPEGLVP